MYTITWESRKRSGLSKRYQMPRDGQWLRPVTEHYTVACCDCGSVHKVDFRIVDGNVELRAFRAPRETIVLRRLAFRGAPA
jgi:hypothetical protein